MKTPGSSPEPLPKPQPGRDVACHATPRYPELERQGIKPEEVEELRAWSKKNLGTEKNRKFSEIKRARTHSRIRKGVLLAIAAIGLSLMAANSDNISTKGQEAASWWEEGFNDEPRGPYPGITFKDQDKQRRLQCLSDLFADESALLPNIGGNKWVGENCGDVTDELNQDHLFHTDPLTAIANGKNAELRAAGIQSDHPNEHAAVEWWDLPLGMKVQTNEDRLEEIQDAQMEKKGSTDFEIE